MAITHICLSDLHLGAETSLLTELDTAGKPRYAEASLVLRELATNLRRLALAQNPPPTLVLAGDVLELALARTHEAGMCFERFLDEFFPEGEDAFDPRILYIPGNHDHHLWESAREEHFTAFLGTLGPSSELTEAWNVTRMFPPKQHDVDWPTSQMLNALLRRHEHRTGRKSRSSLEIRFVYPNYGVLNAPGTRAVAISHGHYVESTYKLMSTLRQFVFDRPAPVSIAEIEAENFAWVDFFWSTLGRSGGAGNDVQLFYELIGTKDGVEKISKILATKIVETWFKGGLPDGLQRSFIAKVLKNLIGRVVAHERGDARSSMGDETAAGLREYVDGPLIEQLQHEYGKIAQEKHFDQVLPEDLTFVFGHTHKPFVHIVEGKNVPNQRFKAINMGGWVIDSVERQEHHGASVVFIDDRLDCESLQMFVEPERGATPGPVSVAGLPGDVTTTELAERLQEDLRTHRAVWGRFSQAVGLATKARADALARRSSSL